MQTGVNDGLKGFIEESRTERQLRTPQNSPVEKNQLIQVAHRWVSSQEWSTAEQPKKSPTHEKGHGDLGKTKKPNSDLTSVPTSTITTERTEHSDTREQVAAT